MVTGILGGGVVPTDMFQGSLVPYLRADCHHSATCQKHLLGFRARNGMRSFGVNLWWCHPKKSCVKGMLLIWGFSKWVKHINACRSFRCGLRRSKYSWVLRCPKKHHFKVIEQLIRSLKLSLNGDLESHVYMSFDISINIAKTYRIL